jgi:ABC-type transporter Mla subunit MlaD
MSPENQRFIEAEHTAEQLVKSLQALQREASVYQTTTQELVAVRQKVVALVDAATENAKQMRELIVELKEFGPEALTTLAALRERLKMNTYLIIATIAIALGTVALVFKTILIK